MLLKDLRLNSDLQLRNRTLTSDFITSKLNSDLQHIDLRIDLDLQLRDLKTCPTSDTCIIIHPFSHRYLSFFFLSLSLFCRKAHLILRRVDRISLLCRSLLRSGYIQSRTESMSYVMCRSEDMRLASSTWHSSLHETRLTCAEKILSVQRNIYGKSKLR